MIPFDLAEPTSLAAAIKLLNPDDPSVRPIAGGTALMLMMKAGVFNPEKLVSLRKIEGKYSSISAGSDGLRIGAMTTLGTLERSDDVRIRARAPRLEAVSTVGAGDTLLAAIIAARMNDRSYEDAVRSSVAASAASVLEAGPGRFDFREAQRLGSHVTLDRLEPVRQDA